MQKIKKLLPFIIPPIAVMFILGLNFYNNGVFPFGEGTIAWCDMTQQVIPLLADLKDILTGKAGVFLNFQNAGGMNMWAVIFFFVASPFSLLVAFVEKTDIIYFVNILLFLKLMTCSVTSMVYFKSCQKQLPDMWAGIFSVVYAFSGYAMLYYQNIIWLDMMYLFPLLIVAFRSMFESKKIAPYVAVLTAFMIVNYYISYMIVIFILLFMGLFCFRYRKDENYRQAPVHFVIGSMLAAMLSAVVWIPSFIQYLGSGRTEGFFDKVRESGFFTPYQTTIPTIISAISVIAITAVCLLDGKARSKKLNTYLIMLFLTLVPLYVEPVNIMWHTGSYMSFPSRFGFITQFILIICAGHFLDSGDKLRCPKEKKRCDNVLLIIGGSAMVYLFYVYALNLVTANLEDFSNYTRTLWGNDTSFHLAIRLGIIAGFIYTLLYLVYRKGYFSKQILALFVAVIAGVEAYCNVSVYMSSPHMNYPERAANQRKVVDLADKIDDNSGFYRVNTTEKLFDINLVGAMGYNSISHYTSLTSEDYMFMMKRLGYSSYWMEVGSYGGTELTDALMSIKYTISDNQPETDTIYYNGSYSIDESGYYLPLGLMTPSDKDFGKQFSEMTRAEIQQYVYENTIGTEGDTLITSYECDTPEAVIERPDGTYQIPMGLAPNCTLTYTIDVKNRQSLYFDCFDVPSNNLNEEINKSFSVRVNGETVENEYPTQKQNGLVKLGEYENERVTVTIRELKNCECRSFGVFGLDLDKLESSIASAKTVNFSADRGTLSGSITAQAGEKCLLAIPYSDTLKVEINGSSADFEKGFDDLVLISLSEGENRITVTNVPKGFIIGLILTIIGVGMCILYKLLGTKMEPGDKICKAFGYLIMLAGVMVLAVIYIIPVVINIRS